MQSPLSVGQFAGKWCSYNAPPDLPYDQREEDGGSLIFDGDALTERMEILGAPAINKQVCRELWTKVIPGILDDFDCPNLLPLFATGTPRRR